MLLSFVPIFVAAGALVASSARAQEPAAAGAVDLRTVFKPGDAVELNWKLDGSGAGKIQLPSSTIDMPISNHVTARFLDECVTEGDGPPVWLRTWLDVRATEDGRVRDPAWNGITVRNVFEGENVDLTLGGRIVPRRDLDGFLRQSAFLGACIDWPVAATIGQKLAFSPADAAAVMQTLFACAGEPIVRESSWTFSAVDLEAGVASVQGRVVFDEKVVEGATTMNMHYVVDLDAAFGLAEHRLRTLTAKSVIEMTGTLRRGASMSGRVEASGTLTAKPVQNAAALRKAAPKFRANQWDLDRAGASVEIASCWAELPDDGTAKPTFIAQFVDSRVAEPVVMQFIENGDDVGDPTTDEYITLFTANVQKSGLTNVKAKKSKTALGKALSYSADSPQDRRIVGVVTSIAAGGKLTVQVVGPAALMKSVDSDLQKVVASLKPKK